MARIALWEGSRFGAPGGDLGRFFTEGGPRNIIFRSEVQVTHTYWGRLLFLRGQADTGNCQSSTARGYLGYGDGRISGSAIERGA